MAVLVQRDINTQRMYRHIVTTKENLLGDRVSSADAEASGRSGSSRQGGLTKILQVALNFKRDSVPLDPKNLIGNSL